MFWLAIIWFASVLGLLIYLNADLIEKGEYSGLTPIAMAVYGTPSIVAILLSQLLNFRPKHVLLYLVLVATIIVVFLTLKPNYGGLM